LIPNLTRWKIIANDDSIQYIYDASGVKWLKEANTGSLIETVCCGSFVYEWNNDSSKYKLDYVLNPEGMIDINGSTSAYQYYLRDHLGNTRVVLYDEGESIQTADYYPFGMEFTGIQGGVIKYLFNGKELQDNVLDGVGLEWYDYGARFYDLQFGRLNVMDALAEKHFEKSGYSYVHNNPVKLIDHIGLDLLILSFTVLILKESLLI
jgi:RHS repeat-associated protein